MRINSSSKPNDITTPRTNQSMDSASCRLDLVFSAALLFFFSLTWWTCGHASNQDSWPWLGNKTILATKLLTVTTEKKTVPGHFGCIAMTSVPVAGQFGAVVNAKLRRLDVDSRPTARFSDSPRRQLATWQQSTGLTRKAFAFVWQTKCKTNANISVPALSCPQNQRPKPVIV